MHSPEPRPAHSLILQKVVFVTKPKLDINKFSAHGSPTGSPFSMIIRASLVDQSKTRLFLQSRLEMREIASGLLKKITLSFLAPVGPPTAK